ncbi:hypothetical protein CRUP_019086 [Coryphaenoides rupestris]|nr:hypothetical protein CRUP_019086 [Coryphaenoides rupestris]
MKFFTVILAVVAFSACHGRMLPQDEAWSGLEAAVDGVREYLSDLNVKANDLVQDLQRTQVVRELDTLTQDTMSELALYRDNLNTKLVPFTQERAEELARDLQLMGDKLQTNMAEASVRAADYSQELRNVLEQSASDLSATFNTYARKIRKRARTADNAQLLQRQVSPYLEQVRDQTEAKLSTINRLLTSQADAVAKRIESSTEDIRQRFDKTSENLRSTLVDKTEELRDWLSRMTGW